MIGSRCLRLARLTPMKDRLSWCGPCVLMAPEFEAAAQDLKGKVRFVKIDTDKDEIMASRLNIMGLPTLLSILLLKMKLGESTRFPYHRAWL
eukprot:scaffold22611_cov153-Cylindrotheca_fusiformis.AAC.6